MFKNIFNCKKSNLPILKIGFFLVLLFSLVTIFQVFLKFNTQLRIKNLISPLESVVMNIDVNKPLGQDFFVCYASKCLAPVADVNSKMYYSIFNHEYNNTDGAKIKNITLAYPVSDKDFLNKIEKIDLHIGNKNLVYTQNDLLKKDKKTLKIEVNNIFAKNKTQTKEYNTINISDFGNYRGVFANICSLFLSLFYNWQVFIIPFVWLFLLYIFYLYKKDELNINLSKIKIKTPYIFFGILFLAFIFRIVNISYYHLWTDEVYTKTVAIQNFISCFKDPGNPPLFFILEFLVSKIFGTFDVVLRFPSLVFGCASVFGAYLLFKKISTLSALFASFLVSINTVLIYHSTEARSSSLCAFLIVFSIYFLFEYLKNPNFKTLVIYSLFSIFCLNTHYYLVFFVFCNFIWAICSLLQDKKNDRVLSFIVASFISALTLLPYLFVSLNNALNGTFNTWIPKFTHEILKYTINEYFINKYIFIFLCFVVFMNLIFIYLPKNYLEKINVKINDNKSDLLLYLVYCLAFILIISSFVSIFIKPIFHKRVLLSVYMLLLLLEIINIIGIVEFIKQTKLTKIFNILYVLILSFVVFAITKPMPVRQIYNTYDYMNLIENDYDKYKNNFEIHAFDSDQKEYLKNYPNVKNMPIKWHYVNGNGDKHLEKLNIFDYTDKNKKAVIYIHAFAGEISQIADDYPNSKVYKSNSVSTLKIEYNPKGEQK